MNVSEFLLAAAIGVGLAAACGFRVFVPMLVLALAANAGHVTLSANFQWIGSDAAVIAFALATALEIGAYYVPWLDSLLDSVASPAAVVAGVVATASVTTQQSPLLGWAIALIAGGGVAATVQSMTVTARTASTATTGGLANRVVARTETLGSIIMAIVAIVAPILAVVAVAVLGVYLFRRWSRPRLRLAQEIHRANAA